MYEQRIPQNDIPCHRFPDEPSSPCPSSPSQASPPVPVAGLWQGSRETLTTPFDSVQDAASPEGQPGQVDPIFDPFQQA